MKHELVSSDAELRLEQDGELLLRHRLGAASVRAFDALQRLDSRGTGTEGQRGTRGYFKFIKRT